MSTRESRGTGSAVRCVAISCTRSTDWVEERLSSLESAFVAAHPALSDWMRGELQERDSGE